MNIIVCIDKNGGMMFGGRRQSRDEQVILKILDITSHANLLMSEYSFSMFKKQPNIVVNNNFISMAQSTDFCFIEDKDIPNQDIEDIIIFHWNRDYPADKYFDFDFKQNGYKRIEKEDFKGTSHDKITLEIYRRVQQ